MAKSRKRSTTYKSSRWPWLFLALLVGLAVLWWFYGAQATGYAQTGTSYMAHIGCSCRYIEGRDLDSCKTDKMDGMALVTLSDNPDNMSVTARFPLLSSQTATYRKGYGCVLQQWAD